MINRIKQLLDDPMFVSKLCVYMFFVTFTFSFLRQAFLGGDFFDVFLNALLTCSTYACYYFYRLLEEEKALSMNFEFNSRRIGKRVQFNEVIRHHIDHAEVGHEMCVGGIKGYTTIRVVARVTSPNNEEAKADVEQED